jgi:2-polyprenyl-3-methyl-5-hydroxy-6-metoxy-1,4-benzoquinol methylase
MRQGQIPREQLSFSSESYAGGEERYRKQRLEKESTQLVDYLKVLPKLERILPTKGRLLEIGCSTGLFLSEIHKAGWEAHGVEPLEWACSRANEKNGLNVVNAYFQEAGYAEETFDAVVMLHVIEHIPNPAKALRELHKLIRPGGVLVMETPRYDTIWFKLLKGRERSVIPGHLHYFTRSSLKEMALKAGFELIELNSVGRTLTLDRLCYNLSKVSNSEMISNNLTRLSDSLHLNRARIHINIRDMMRLYLRKR